jgi:TRAP-type C4-dicarboxylate transport system permease small subunit
MAANPEATGGTLPRSRFTRGLEILCALMLAVMVVLLFIQVFSRYALSDPPDWTEELARAVFVYLSFVGGALAIVRNAHLKIQTLHERLAPNARAALDIALTLVGVLFLAVVVLHSFTLLSQLAHQPMTSVPISKAFVFAGVPVGCGLMLVYELRRLVASVRALGHPR